MNYKLTLFDEEGLECGDYNLDSETNLYDIIEQQQIIDWLKELFNEMEEES